MSKITPLGHLEEESEKGQKDFFWRNPLVPWWVKAACWLRPALFEPKEERKPTWCKDCGRKHDRLQECEALHKVEDLTAPSTKEDEAGRPLPNTPVGFYSTRTDS